MAFAVSPPSPTVRLKPRRAMAAAAAAFPKWRATPAKERLRLLRKVAQLIEERVYQISAALTLEVGKNRMEALGIEKQPMAVL